MRVTFKVNGTEQVVDHVWEGESLLFVLRERIGLPGSKNACEQGECGSCTVYIDGRTACACLVAAGQAQGREVRTVEGLAAFRAQRDGVAQAGLGGEETLAPIQQAFVECGAIQCGFCTPGLLIQADDLIERIPGPSETQIREELAGNLCRCTGYEKILDAVRLAAARTSAHRGDAELARGVLW
jgi:carbon-monoxide dehydrogenase small subunit